MCMQELWSSVVRKRWPQVSDDARSSGEGISRDVHVSDVDMVAAEYIADAHRAVKRLGHKLEELAMSSSLAGSVGDDRQTLQKDDATPPVPKRKRLSNSGKKSGSKKCQRPLQDNSPNVDGGKICGNKTADNAYCESSDDEDEYVIESTAP